MAPLASSTPFSTQVVFASVPLNRLVASDIRSQPGSLTALLIIIIIVLVIAVNQVRVIRSTGHLPKYLTLAIIGGLIIALLAAVPETGLRLHHYIIALALVCFCGFSTRLSLIYCAFLLGMYTNGVARWVSKPRTKTKNRKRETVCSISSCRFLFRASTESSNLHQASSETESQTLQYLLSFLLQPSTQVESFLGTQSHLTSQAIGIASNYSSTTYFDTQAHKPVSMLLKRCSTLTSTRTIHSILEMSTPQSSTNLIISESHTSTLKLQHSEISPKLELPS